MSVLTRSLPFQSSSLHHALLYAGVLLCVTLSGLPDADALQVTPTSLTFQAVQGGNNPASQSLTLFKYNDRVVTWHSSERPNVTWITVSPVMGSITNSGQITVGVNAAGLTAGIYTTTLTFTLTSGASVHLPVTFTVTAAPMPPAIGASPTSFSFTAQQGGSNPATQALTISNSGGGTLTWSASENVPWLTVSPASGSGQGSIILTVMPGTLAAGSYSAIVTLNATGAPSIKIPVTFTVTAAPMPPAIGASPTSFSFTAQQGGSNPATQALTISNSGGGTLTWSASENVPWLTVSPASGSGQGSIILMVMPGTLAAGSYSAIVTLNATGATPVTIPVSFTLTPASAAGTIGLTPTAFSFTATQGAANPSSQTLNITNPGTGTLSWSVADNANWLTLSPSSGTTTTATSPSTLLVNTAGLTAGTFSATITVTASGATNTPQTIPVTLTLNAPTTSSATLTWNASTSSSVAGYKVYQATASGAYGPAIATLQGNVLGYTATGLLSGTTYFFTITAYDQSGTESLHSNEVSKSIY